MSARRLLEKTKEAIAPHLPKEVREKGRGDLDEQKWFLKLFLLAVVFGFFSGIVGGMVVNSQFFDSWLWGEGGAWKLTAERVRRSESRSLTQDNLSRKALASTVDFYVVPAKTTMDQLPDPSQKVGAGVVLTADGYIATSREIFSRVNKNDMAVLRNDRSVYRIKKVIFDTVSDLALVKVEGGDFSVLPFVSAEGLYNGLDLWLPSANRGIQPVKLLSINFFGPRAKADYYVDSENIYRLGLINNSFEKNYLGSPLVTGRGEVAGILIDVNVFLRTEVIESGLKNILSQGVPRRAYLGAHYLENVQLVGEGKVKLGWGITLLADPFRHLPALEKKSPLFELGLKAGDVIVSVAGEAVTPLRSLPEILIDYAPGDKLEIKYERGGEEKTVMAVLGEVR